jgi:hypothetical protein
VARPIRRQEPLVTDFDPRGLASVPAQRTPTRWTQTVAEKLAEPDTVADETAAIGPGPLEVTILMLLGLLWLAATLRLADALISANRDDAGQMASAISLALPTVVYASLAAGCAVGLGTGLLRVATGGPIRRAIVGALGGAVLGLVTVSLILLRYGGASSTVVLAVTVGVAAVLGAGAAALPRPILAAAVTGTLELFLVGVLAGLFQTPLKSVFGATNDPTSQLHAASLLSIATAVVQGLVVGLTAYFYLRRRLEAPRWPAFAAAGALPGVILLVGLLLSYVGSSGLSNLSGDLSDADRVARDIVSGAGLNQAITVAFVGAIVAMIAIGRKLRRPDDEDEELAE